MSYLKALQNITVCLSANAHWDLKPPFWLLPFSGVTLAASSHCTTLWVLQGWIFFPSPPFTQIFVVQIHLPSSSAPLALQIFWITGEKICLYLIFLAIKNAKGAVGFHPIPELPFLLPWLKGIRITCGSPGRWEKSASWGGLGPLGFHFSRGQRSWMFSLFPSLQNCKGIVPKSSLQLPFIVLDFVSCKLVAEDVELEFKAGQVWISL